MLLESRNQAFQKTPMNITKAQKQQKEMYDKKKHLQKELEVGTKVFLKTLHSSKGRVGKWSPLGWVLTQSTDVLVKASMNSKT